MLIEVKRSREDKKPLSVEYDFGTCTASAMALFNTDGPYGDVVHHLFVQAALMQLREFVIHEVSNGTKPGPALEAKVAEWKPRVKHQGKPPLEKALKATANLTAEERAALLKALQS